MGDPTEKMAGGCNCRRECIWSFPYFFLKPMPMDHLLVHETVFHSRGHSRSTSLASGQFGKHREG